MKRLVGIWGFGITGLAAARFFIQRGYDIWIMDNSEEQRCNAQNRGFTAVSQEHIERFLRNSDVLFASGGIDISAHYAIYANKWVHEVDLFEQAISGTVGITSTSFLLSELLNKLDNNSWV